jgi:glycerophosphoryl diester phosphodiesterase
MNITRGRERPFFQNSRNKPEVIAHRGGAGQWPGETLFAFERALKLGVDVIEMDVHSTSDNELVLIHNKTLEETTNSTKLVKRHTLAELKELDAGYRWTADEGKTFPFRRDASKGIDIRIPTLEETFRAFPQARMNIEIKQKTPSIAQPLAQMIRKYGMEDKVLIASFSHKALKEFRRECPEVATSASALELFKFVTINTLFPGSGKLPGVDAVQIGYRYFHVPLPFINKRTVRAARRLNLPIHAWTINRLDDMHRMLSLEVDGIITDYPCCLIELLKLKRSGKITDEILRAGCEQLTSSTSGHE